MIIHLFQTDRINNVGGLFLWRLFDAVNVVTRFPAWQADALIADIPRTPLVKTADTVPAIRFLGAMCVISV